MKIAVDIILDKEIKQYKIIDKNGDVLEIGTYVYGENKEEVLYFMGIKLNQTTWEHTWEERLLIQNNNY